jgi:hypothetical protein
MGPNSGSTNDKAHARNHRYWAGFVFSVERSRFGDVKHTAVLIRVVGIIEPETNVETVGGFECGIRVETENLVEPKERLYPALSLSDEKLLEEIFSTLSSSVNTLANPYSDDGSYVAAIIPLPCGLRALAATHHLDVSLTLDDISWHFLNFGEPGLVRETEAGLRELGLGDMADWFAEASRIVNPLRPEINLCRAIMNVSRSTATWLGSRNSRGRL